MRLLIILATADCFRGTSAPERDCGKALIVRDWYEIRDYQLDAGGTCPDCGGAIAGRYGKFGGQFGRRRIPIRMRASAA